MLHKPIKFGQLILASYFFLNYFSISAQSTMTQAQVDSLWGIYNTEFIKKADYQEALKAAKLIGRFSALLNNDVYVGYAKIAEANCHLRLNDWESVQASLKAGDQTIQELEEGPYQIDLLTQWHYLFGKYHLKLWNQESAAFHFEQIIQIGKEQKAVNPIILKDAYLDQGLVFRRMGDMDKAIDYYQYGLGLLSPKKEREISQVHQNIGRANFKKNDFIRAMQSYQTALIFLGNNPPKSRRDTNNLALVYWNIGEYFIEVGQLDSAQYFLTKAVPFTIEELGQIKWYRRQAAIHLQKNQPTEAQAFFDTAFQISLAIYSEKHPETARTLWAIGEHYEQQQGFESAMNYYQRAIQALCINYASQDWKTPLTMQAVSGNKRLLLKVLQSKAKLTTKMGFWEMALPQYELIIELIEAIRLQDIVSDESLFFLITQSKTIYENAIQTAIKLGQTTTAFRFSQKAHGMKLLQGLQHQKAQKSGDLPDSLQLQERSLKIALTGLQNQYHQEKEGTAKNNLQKQLFETQLQYDELIAFLEENYPSYLAIRYELPEVAIRDLQKSVLDKSTALIEYFVGKDTLYIFVVTKENAQVLTTPLTEQLFKNISIFHHQVTHFSHDLANFIQFSDAANQLHEKLLAPALATCSSDIDHLLIIPDEELNYLSFGAFLQKSPSNREELNYYKLPYLMKNYAIAYNYSSALTQFHQKTKSNRLLDFVGFAPRFDGNSSTTRNLAALEFNRKEVIQIDSILNGNVYLDETATLENFKQDLPNFRIAHLATHATCNDTMPFNSRIFFQQKSLSLYEIYNLEQQLDMVVLSACETGTGKLRKGEGIQSLARAFLQSGCKSVLTSLWTVNDEQTPQLMQSFYKNLMKRGVAKHDALAQSQRYFIDNQPITYAHPFYWATFIQIGDSTALYPARNWKWVWIGVGLVVLVFFIRKFW